LKALGGCEEPAQEAVWEDGEDTYYSCPIHFIPENVAMWYEEYAYAKEFGTTIEWGDRTARWLEAMKVYRRHYDAGVSEMASRQKAKYSGGRIARINDGT